MPIKLLSDNNTVALVRELVLRGCSVHTADANGMTALHHAAQHGLVEVAKLLKQLCDSSTSSSSSSSSTNSAGSTAALLLNTADKSG